jgi:Tol biopolymer transport system component
VEAADVDDRNRLKKPWCLTRSHLQWCIFSFRSKPMNRFDSDRLPHRRLVGILGVIALAATASLYFLSVSAETGTLDKPEAISLVNGKLAFVRTRAGQFEFQQSIVISNPDGSGQSGLPVPVGTNHRAPTWSPDGTKMLVVTSPTQQSFPDIFLVNSDGSNPVNLTNSEGIEEDVSSWSVNGKIAYETAASIWTMNPDGSGKAPFPGITQPAPSFPAWSPNGSTLAFVSGNRVWLIDANGANQRRLTTGTVNEGPATWSPDGSKLAFGRAGVGIVVVNADGTNEIPISSGSDGQPAWSPDGAKIAFSRSNGSRGLYTMDADGSNQVLIVADTINFPLPCCDTTHGSPAWEPVVQPPNTFSISGRLSHATDSITGATVNLTGTTNATAITDGTGNYSFAGLVAGGNYTVSPSVPRHYFAPANRTYNSLSSNQTANFDVLAVCQSGRCARNGRIAFTRNGEVLTINADGTAATNITNNGADDRQPSWSPDGVKLVFTTNRDGNYEIYRQNHEGDPNPTRLTNNSATDHGPAYSPDGSLIVFVSNRDGNDEIYRMNADGSDQIRLTNHARQDYGPSFSPDGRRIIFLTYEFGVGSSMRTMNIDGTDQQLLPGSNFAFHLYENRVTYSPDGRKLIFTFGEGGTNFKVTWTSDANGSNRAQFPASGRDGTYSPDGEKVAYSCCQFNSTNRLMTSDKNGASPKNLTPSNSGNFEPHWQGFQVKRAAFDFDGDGRSDPAIFRASAGDWWYLASTDNSQRAAHWGAQTDVLAPADFDGDLKTDHAVWRPSDGNFYVLNSFNSTIRVENFGLAGDIPTGGDFDGDNKADVAVYRAGAQSFFYYRGSMGNPQGNITFVPWGMTGDRPIVGDYDGDGRTDAAIFRPSNGTWYIRKSSDGQLQAYGFGLADDKIVSADFDGDGRSDPAVYRAGVWYLLQSTQGISIFQFGIAGDIPVPADYSGDGRADAAVFRNGIWWTFDLHTGGTNAVPFGVNSDIPIQSAFVR